MAPAPGIKFAWAHLGFSIEDLEWFFNLDEMEQIIIRTPHQQESMTLTTDMDSGAMQNPTGNAFHPARGIGQGDTPSTLIFIAFDILLKLLNHNDTKVAHAYADDLIHLTI
jgi:hypothetical protein